MTEDLSLHNQLLRLATESPLEDAAPASSRLQSKIYSALILAMEEQGPLLPLPETKQSGRALCIFENLVQILPAPPSVQSLQYCKVCHAKALAERLEHAPIYWPGCPYCEFQNR